MIYNHSKKVFPLFLFLFLLVGIGAPLFAQKNQGSQIEAVAPDKPEVESDYESAIEATAPDKPEVEPDYEAAQRESFFRELRTEFPQDLPFFGSSLFALSKRELPAWQNILYQALIVK